MSYQVFARKWRPRTFKAMVGQQHVLKALTHALNHNQIHHAYLFTGTRGVGKTTLARIFAKCLNCEEGVSADPCGHCVMCQGIDQGRFPDLIEIDAASRTKVEDTRELLENVIYAPSQGRYKVYLIDEVHMLSGHSFNALLKTLEEPPEHVKFILATTDPQKLPATVLSRCLQFHLKKLPESLIQAHLAAVLKEEGISFEDSALAEIARHADGSIRDALSLLEQVVGLGEGSVFLSAILDLLGVASPKVTAELLLALLDSDTEKMNQALLSLHAFDPDYEDVLTDMLRLLTQAAWFQKNPAWVDKQDNLNLLKQIAGNSSPELIQLFYQIALLGQKDLKIAPHPRMGFEMVILRMLTFMPVSEMKIAGHVAQTVQSVSVASKKGEVENQPPNGEGLTKLAPPSQNRLENLSSPSQGGLGGSPAVRNHPEIQPFVSKEPTPEKSVSHQKPTLSPDNFDWHALVPQLKLAGIPLLIATHCAFKRKEGKQLTLGLQKSQGPLLNDRLKQIIEKAIAEVLQEPILLKIEIGDVDSQSPVAKAEAIASEKKAQVFSAVEADPNIQTILQTLGAEINYEQLQVKDNV